MCVYYKRTPAAVLEGLWGSPRALTDLSGPHQLRVGLLPRDLGALFKPSPQPSVHAWAVLEEYWSPTELQPCLCLATDAIDPDPDVQADFPA